MFLGGLAYTLIGVWISRASGGDSFYAYRNGIEFVVGSDARATR